MQEFETKFLYALYRASEEFKAALEEYEKGLVTDDELQYMFSTNIQEIFNGSRINEFIDSFLSQNKQFYNIVKGMRFDQVVDIASYIAKEYGKNPDGSYDAFDKTIKNIFAKLIARNFL